MHSLPVKTDILLNSHFARMQFVICLAGEIKTRAVYFSHMTKIIGFISAVFFCFILWIIYLANTGSQSIFFDIVDSIPYGDKLGHFCLFGVLTLGTNFAFKLKKVSIRVSKIYLGTIIVLTFAFAEEFSQFFLKTRTVDVVDLLAGIAGIVVFSFITRYISNNDRISFKQ